MLRVAITGGIACGKSLVGAYLAEQNLAVLDSDDVVHRLLQKGTEVYSLVCEEFGSAVIGAEAEIDRTKLAELVFSSDELLEKLNGIVHPHVEKEWISWLEIQENCGNVSAAAVIIPLLFEKNFDKGWDALVCIASSKAIQAERLHRDDRSSSAVRISKQMPVTEKMQRADYVVLNDGSTDLLKLQVNRILNTIMEKHDA